LGSAPWLFAGAGLFLVVLWQGAGATGQCWEEK